MSDPRFALLIASSEFESDSLKRLRAPPVDVERLADVLQRSDVGGFEVKTIVNQPRTTVEEAIQEFFEDRKRDDLALLYFAGHGLKNDTNNLYFATTDTKRRRLEATAISSRFIQEMIQRSVARQQVLLLDCCFSGAFPRGFTFRADEHIGSGQYFDVRGSGQLILTACDDMQYAFEGEELTTKNVTNSVFTGIVVEGLESGEADVDLDGHISFDDLYDYVVRQLRLRNSSQVPQKWYLGLRDVILARNPNPALRVLAEELRSRVESDDPRIRVGAVIDLGILARKTDGRRRLAAIKELEVLRGDDSRAVSAAATAALTDIPELTQQDLSRAEEEPNRKFRTLEVEHPDTSPTVPGPATNDSIGERGTRQANTSESVSNEAPQWVSETGPLSEISSIASKVSGFVSEATKNPVVRACAVLVLFMLVIWLLLFGLPQLHVAR